MICNHLCDETNLDYARIDVGPQDDDYTTFLCLKCESLLLDEQGWTDRLYEFAGFKIFCQHCNENIISEHTLVAEGKMK